MAQKGYFFWVLKPIHQGQWRANLIVPTALAGYAANVATVSVLGAGEDAIVFSDELNHASIIDGVRLASRNGAKNQVNKGMVVYICRGRGVRKCLVWWTIAAWWWASLARRWDGRCRDVKEVIEDGLVLYMYTIKPHVEGSCRHLCCSQPPDAMCNQALTAVRWAQ